MGNHRHNGTGDGEIGGEHVGTADGVNFTTASRAAPDFSATKKLFTAAQVNLERLTRAWTADFLLYHERDLRVLLQMTDDLRERVAVRWHEEIAKNVRQTIRMTLGYWRKMHLFSGIDPNTSPAYQASQTCLSWPFCQNLVPVFELLGEYLRDHHQMHGTTKNAHHCFRTDRRGHRAMQIALDGMTDGEQLLAAELVTLAARVTWPEKTRSDAEPAAGG